MLIIELIGGLGNQMFQYAFGRSMSIQLGVPVKFDAQNLLDRRARANFTYRDFELGIFDTVVPLVDASDTALYRSLPISGIAWFNQRVRRKILKPVYFVEKEYFVYDAEVLKVGRSTYFEGYWQNENYFKRYETLIRQAFTFKTPLTGLNKSLAAEIAAVPAVAMHIRRGDYLTNKQSNEIHGICIPAYYQEALSLMQERVKSLALFVFSDEPDWVKENLHFEVPTTYVSHNQGKNSFEDMRLMSLCQHNIIANSSFSWWGAWLNANPDKVVVAPRQWMQLESINSLGLIPNEWIRI